MLLTQISSFRGELVFLQSKRILPAILASTFVALLSGCGKSEEPVKGFILPPGDAAKGEIAFVEIGCNKCHTVVGADIEQPASEKFRIELGEDARRVRHYGDLLNSVVNPDHKVSAAYRVRDESNESFASPMPKFTNKMTVEQMTNIVEFLHKSYEKNHDKYSGRYYYYRP